MLPSKWAGALDALGHRMDTQDAAAMATIMRRRNTREWSILLTSQKIHEVKTPFLCSLTHRRYRPQTRRFSPAVFSFAVVIRDELLLLPFEAILLSECACGRKSGSPPPLAPSFKVQGDIAHN